MTQLEFGELDPDELRHHAETLEQIVQERTAKLQKTVNELEQYSYSISHDMRAPLRAMNQFSHILVEEYGPKLDPQAQFYLGRIAAAATRLDCLIKDVLSYVESRSEQKSCACP